MRGYYLFRLKFYRCKPWKIVLSIFLFVVPCLESVAQFPDSLLKSTPNGFYLLTEKGAKKAIQMDLELKTSKKVVILQSQQIDRLNIGFYALKSQVGLLERNIELLKKEPFQQRLKIWIRKGKQRTFKIIASTVATTLIILSIKK
jgi:hypothetical protein